MKHSGKSLQYLLFGAGFFSSLQTGFHVGWPSYALPQLLSNSSTIPLTNDEGSWVASIFLLGTIFGSILSAVTIDTFGKKKMLLATLLLLCGSWFVIAHARRSLELYIARFVGGLSDGLTFSCLPLYLSEICDPKIRGLLITATNAVHLFGVLLANILGAFFNITEVALVACLLSLAIILYSFVPESPYFFMLKEDVPNAAVSVEKYHGGEEVDKTLNKIKDALKRQHSDTGTWRELFSDKRNRTSLLLIVTGRVLQQLSGSIGMISYTQTLFKEADKDVNPVVFVTIYYVLQILVLIINAIVIDRLGRRPLLIASMSTVAVALFIVSSYFTLENVAIINVGDYSWCPILGLFLYIMGFTFGLQNVLAILASEMFPFHVKSYAMSVYTISYSLTATPVLKFFQYTKDAYGLHVPFIVFTICSMCGIPFFIFCIPETKNKSLEEVQSQLRSKENLNMSNKKYKN